MSKEVQQLVKSLMSGDEKSATEKLKTIVQDKFIDQVKDRKVEVMKTAVTNAVQIKESADLGAADELELYMMNDGQLYRSRIQPAIKNMQRKIKSGKFDPRLAPKLWSHVVTDAAKKYSKEFASPAEWNKIFTKATRDHLAASIAKEMEDRIREGDFD